MKYNQMIKEALEVIDTLSESFDMNLYRPLAIHNVTLSDRKTFENMGLVIKPHKNPIINPFDERIYVATLATKHNIEIGTIFFAVGQVPEGY